jgi:hypothetical protein
MTLSARPNSQLITRSADLETPSHRVLAASEDNGLAASATSPGLARSTRGRPAESARQASILCRHPADPDLTGWAGAWIAVKVRMRAARLRLGDGRHKETLTIFTRTIELDTDLADLIEEDEQTQGHSLHRAGVYASYWRFVSSWPYRVKARACSLRVSRTERSS